MSRYITERELISDTLLKEGDYISTKEMLYRVARLIPDAPALGELDSEKNIIIHTEKQVCEDVEHFADGLIDMGLEGKHIAIVADNSYRYVIAELAVSSGVGVVIPIDKDAPVPLLVTLLNKCDAEAVLCSSFYVKKLEEARREYPALATIVTIDKKVDGYAFYEEISERGLQLSDNGYFRNKELDPDVPVKILFTSGTTGANKGVLLTQRNLAANIMNCIDTIKTRARDEINTSMSVLPMHHATEINTHILVRMAAGRLTYINDNMKNLMVNIKIFKPKTITIVPMIANAFYKNIMANAKKLGKEKKLQKGIAISNLLRRIGINKTHSLFKDIFAPFGGNLDQIVCGGSMLNPTVVKGFSDLGVDIVNGYGITECGPLISMNTETVNEWKSVGRACPALTAKIENPDENGVGDLCIKGASVSHGYYKDDKATKEAFFEDGFFNTGDSAYIDKKGRIFLVGRKKNTIVLPNGKNVCPEEVENAIENNMPYVNDVVVYYAPVKAGSNEIFALCAGIYISDETARDDIATIEADVRKANSVLPSYKQIEYINLVSEEYQKTSTRKIKRDTVMVKHDSIGGIRLV